MPLRSAEMTPRDGTAPPSADREVPVAAQAPPVAVSVSAEVPAAVSFDPLEAPQQFMKQFKARQNPNTHRHSDCAHSTSRGDGC